MSYNYKKYKSYAPVNLTERTWPGKVITKAPDWVSVDLRDGNQALPIPMSVEEKIELFNLLLNIGFKEIEIGFPSASETEYAFLRTLIDQNMIPDDVTVQILTQSRDHLIKRSFEALDGSKNAIVHFYNSTSTLQREVVFKKNRKDIIKIATDGASLIKDIASEVKGCNLRYEYSPESFTGTEMDYAVEICEAVIDVMKPTPDNKLILNLPATVEMSTPNIYADQIEWFCRNIKDRDSLLISLHTHNDRGTGVAASELGLMAGADRVEGTLFGNGERTGNVDIITLAMNLYSQGIDSELDFAGMPHIVSVYERTTRMSVHQRHPYAGELVYTAFSGSHQDAIKKGIDFISEAGPDDWEVPYLPLDPGDLGREYQAIIRINSQSGKGGIAYILDTFFGYKLPKDMHPEFSSIIQHITDGSGRELKPDEIMNLFKQTYLQKKSPFSLKKYTINALMEETDELEENRVEIEAVILVDGVEHTVKGKGNGPIDAFYQSLAQVDIPSFSFISYSEHDLGKGADATAVAYIHVKDEQGKSFFGVGQDPSISAASLKALLCAANRILEN